MDVTYTVGVEVTGMGAGEEWKAGAKCSLQPEHQNELWWHLLGGRSRSRSLMSDPSGVVCLRVCMRLCSAMPKPRCACGPVWSLSKPKTPGSLLHGCVGVPGSVLGPGSILVLNLPPSPPRVAPARWRAPARWGAPVAGWGSGKALALSQHLSHYPRPRRLW